MLKRLKTIFNQYRIFILLAALVPILSFVFFFRQKQPQIPPSNPVFGNLPQPETNYGFNLKSEATYQFSIPQNTLNQLPVQAKVYQVKKLPDQEGLTHFAQIANELGFTTKPKFQTSGDYSFYIWEEAGQFLKVNSQTGQFTFKGSFTLSLGSISPQEAEALVKEKMTELGLIVKETSTAITYYGSAGIELVPVDNPNAADVYGITFSSSVDGYPLIGFGPAKDLTLAQITEDGRLFTLNYYLHSVDLEGIGVYPLEAVDGIFSQIQQGQGKILSLKTQSGNEVSLNSQGQIKSINLSSVELAYYESIEKQEYLQPVYLFSGTATLEDNTLLEVSLYLPAISPEWLIQTSPTPVSKFKVE
jgi:hypothetical protein